MKRQLIRFLQLNSVMLLAGFVAITVGSATATDTTTDTSADIYVEDETALQQVEHAAESTSESSGYAITSFVVAGGGGTSSSDSFKLSGTIGQHEAGVMEGSGYTLIGGFWAGAADADEPNCPIVGDINCDGTVDGLDLLILLSEWGECTTPGDCPADLNGDGVVDGLDLLMLLSNWS